MQQMPKNLIKLCVPLLITGGHQSFLICKQVGRFCSINVCTALFFYLS